MKEIKKCSISGVAFTMDIDAYEALEAYLESLKENYRHTPDGTEIVADIEARIAELILSAQDNTRVVEKPLMMNIIAQMGSAEDISDESSDRDLQYETPRIPRRLYRDTENAKLGGVCAGIGKYFDIDPVWVRLTLFLPLLLSCFGGIPFLFWFGPLFGNLFGIFLICYFIMWFAVPAARTARQKLEMNGQRITAQSISEVTAAAANNDPDAKAKPIIAEAVSLFGKIVLILLKIFAGILVFGLIMGACALVIALIAVVIGGPEQIHLDRFADFSLWVPVLGIFIVLIPVILMIYVLMCLIASRKPSSRSVLIIFLVWLATIIACSAIAIRDNVSDKIRQKKADVERIFHRDLIINGDTTTLERLLKEYDGESFIEEGRHIVHIAVPSESIDITVDKDEGELKINADGKEVSIQASCGPNSSEAPLSNQAESPTRNTDSLRIE
ncbi:PspC domain-containing protein [Alistipes sp.]|uniref:PspC domain-containing protein n=1 Tax=Alistipes sp. TaxID=1872444 RepID=UPI003A8A9BFA